MEPDRKVIKQYFLNNDIKFVKLHLDVGLMICHKNMKKGVKWRESESELSIEEKEIQKYLKKQNKKFLTRTEVDGWTDIEISNSPSSKPTNWTPIISLGLIMVSILLVGLIIFLEKRKRKL